MINAKNVVLGKGVKEICITFNAPGMSFHAQTPFTRSPPEITLFLNIHQKETELVVYRRSEQ